MPDLKLPSALTGTLVQLAHARWSYKLAWSRDASGHLYVTLEAAPFWGGHLPVLIKATWHTRDTGTLRLFSCMARRPGTVQFYDLSLRAARDLITPEPDKADNESEAADEH